MIWTSAKVVLFALWALVLGYFIASLVELFSPATFVAPDGFGAAVVGLALGIFICLWIAFKKIVPVEEDTDVR